MTTTPAPAPGYRTQLLLRELPIWVWALADVSLVVPLFLVIMPWSRQWPVWALTMLALGLILLPFNLARLMTLWHIPLERQRRWMGIGLVATLLLTLRQLLFNPSSLLDLTWLVDLLDHLTIAGYPYWARDFGIIGLVLYTWWRGISLPDRSFSMNWIGLQFRLRALILAPLIIVFGSRRLISDITPFIILFGITHLVMIALSRAEEVQKHETGLAFYMTPRWLAVVVAASAAVVGSSWFIATTAGADIVAQGPQEGALLVVYTVFFTFIYLIAPILFPILEFLTTFLTRLFAPLAALLAQFATGENPAEQPQFEQGPIEEATGLVAQLATYVPALVFLAILAGIIAVVLWWYSQMMQDDEVDLNREQIGLDGRLVSGEKTTSLWDRLRRGLPGFRQWRAARSIRRIYYQMVYAAEHRGVSRLPAQTPYEFLPDLSEIWPDGQTDTELITQAYVRIRYGQLPENPAELQAIVQAWNRLAKRLLDE